MGIRRVKGKFHFKSNMAEMIRFKKKAPSVIANQSLNWFLQGFRKGGHQTDASRGGWARRKKSSKRNKGRAILVDSGDLRRDVQKLKVSFNEIILGTRRIVYARRHNEGITDRLGREMPKREFMGDSKGLTKKNNDTIVKMMDKVMRI